MKVLLCCHKCKEKEDKIEPLYQAGSRSALRFIFGLLKGMTESTVALGIGRPGRD